MSHTLCTQGSFLRKFENGKFGDSEFVICTIKHSGSLIMISGITESGHLLISSKNAMANKYTQVFFVLFTEYMNAVFPDNPEVISDLLTRLYQEKMTLCFELVTPILGAHGGTPLVSYFVLTAVTCNGSTNSALSRQPMDILGLLEIATLYRLPVAGGIIIKSSDVSQEFINTLEKKKYAFLSATLEQAIIKFAEKHPESGIHWIDDVLSHTNLQGEIIEGLVVSSIAINNPIEEHSSASTEEHRSASTEEHRSISADQDLFTDLKTVFDEYKAEISKVGGAALSIFTRMNEIFISMFSDEEILEAFLQKITPRSWKEPEVKVPTEEESDQFLQLLSNSPS